MKRIHMIYHILKLTTPPRLSPIHTLTHSHILAHVLKNKKWHIWHAMKASCGTIYTTTAEGATTEATSTRTDTPQHGHKDKTNKNNRTKEHYEH